MVEIMHETGLKTIAQLLADGTEHVLLASVGRGIRRRHIEDHINLERQMNRATRAQSGNAINSYCDEIYKKTKGKATVSTVGGGPIPLDKNGAMYLV